MIRLTILWATVFGVAAYTWKDWFRGLCCLVLLMAILEMPDVPKSIFGIDGFNFFNLLLLNLVIAWAFGRDRENLKWDLPGHIVALLLVYLGIVLIGFYRMWRDPAYLTDTRASMIAEYLVNTIKWVIPGLLLYDGCRTRERTTVALVSVLGIYAFLAVMVVKVMPIRAVLMSGTDLQKLALKLLVSRIGLHRVTLSMMLAGASWALLSLQGLTKDRRLHVLLLLGAFGILYSQSLTAGRAGYITWGIVGLFLGLLRWRGYLLAAPIMALLVVLLVPSVADRLLEGFAKDQFSSQITVNDYDVTAGRIVIWPLVIDKIKQNMWVGFGRLGMWRTGVVAYISTILQEDFGHPHNAYLEWLLDNGIIGFIPVIIFYLVVLFHAARLFCDRRSGLFMAAGGAACAFVLALLGASFGSQSFYPVEGTVGMWCAIFIMLRVSVQRKQAMTVLQEQERQAWSPLGSFGRARPPVAPIPVSMDALLWPEAPAQFPVRPQPGFRPPLPRPTAAPRPAASAKPEPPRQPQPEPAVVAATATRAAATTAPRAAGPKFIFTTGRDDDD